MTEAPDTDAIRRSAFVAHTLSPFRLQEHGPLAGLSFAVKDLIDVAGSVTACGNPDRLRESEPARSNAPCVVAALEAGATLVGKTHTDEIACGMFGDNPHFGTPINPRAPDRVPGGSSSGSASAVAAGLCDFALGTDTGGSVRVPASFCGLYGVRTTHGRLSTAGVMAMAPSFDSVGWLADDAHVLQRVGTIYFGQPALPKARLMIATDAFAIPVPEIQNALLPVARALGGERDVTLFEEGIETWLDTFRPLQLYDLRTTLGDWASTPGRTLSRGVRERIALSYTVRSEDVAAALPRREAMTDRLVQVLGDDGVILMPTAHDLPPPREASLGALVAFREKTLALTCVASLARLPQVNIPAAVVGGCPVGLSLLGGPRSDALLLAEAVRLSSLLQATR